MQGAKLQREYGLSIGQSRFRRLLKAMNLPKIPARKIPPQASKVACDYEFRNLLNRQFSPKEPNKIWGSDLTYLKVGAKWCYLCVIIDLFSRKVIARQLSDKADSQLVIETFKKAYRKRNCPQGLMFHSDRGSQFTSCYIKADVKARKGFDIIQADRILLSTSVWCCPLLKE